MGRLQKKKDPKKKKNKPNTALATSTPRAANSGNGRNPKAKSSVVSLKRKSVKLEKNIFDKGLQFLREVKVELKKVTWPSRKQTIGSTIVVIILVIAISLFLGLVDIGLSSLIRLVLN